MSRGYKSKILPVLRPAYFQASDDQILAMLVTQQAVICQCVKFMSKTKAFRDGHQELRQIVDRLERVSSSVPQDYATGS